MPTKKTQLLARESIARARIQTHRGRVAARIVQWAASQCDADQEFFISVLTRDIGVLAVRFLTWSTTALMARAAFAATPIVRAGLEGKVERLSTPV